MYIISSAKLRNNYREIAERCKKTGEPVFLTKNGDGELVLMSIESYENLISHHKIEEELRRIELEKKTGTREYVTLDEFGQNIESVLKVAEAESTSYGNDK